MADGDAEADALERLETALDRIAQRTQMALPPAKPQPDADVIKARLDRLIEQLRDALADASADEA